MIKALIVLGVLSVAVSQAAAVVPLTATGSSSYPGYNDFYAIDAAANTDWASFGQGAGSFLDLNLGAVYKLTSAAVTDRVTSGGGNGGFVGGFFDFTTSFSLAAYTDASFTTIVGSALVFNKPLPGSHSTTSDFLDTVTTTGLRGQYIQYKVLATEGVNPGLSDINFQGTVVPEPAMWGLMVVGFGLVGVSTRRRKTIAVA